MKKKAAFTSETALCAEFIANATKDGKWVAYAETGGWDIVMVRKADGFQIGIQAKLTLNAKVLDQSLPDRYWDRGTIGPDCRAVLVPSGSCGGLSRICEFLGITVIRQQSPDERARYAHGFTPDLPSERYSDGSGARHWMEWAPVNRVKLPDFIPDVAAGSSAPVQLTDWKVKALKLCILLEQRPVTRADFKALSLDPSRWTQFWLIKKPEGYVPSRYMPNFKAQHPVNYEQIKAESEKWMTALKLDSGRLI